MKLFLQIFVVFFSSLFCIVKCSVNFNYEAMRNSGFKNRRMQNFVAMAGESYAFPEPLPSSPRSPVAAMPSPYHNLYQGTKVRGDVRVFNKQFKYSAKLEGQLIIIRGEVNCKITHLSAESNGAVPVMLRGGVGYFYFRVIVRSKPGDPLQGVVKAYCRKDKRDDS